LKSHQPRTVASIDPNQGAYIIRYRLRGAQSIQRRTQWVLSGHGAECLPNSVYSHFVAELFLGRI
jgi:hypothetical protein